MLSPPRRSRRAFTLFEILIALAIIALVGAALYPTVAGQLRRGRSAALAKQLNGLRDALADYRDVMLSYPGVLAQLTTQPGVGSTNLCGNVLTAAQLARWRGPYLNQVVAAGLGLPVGDATVRDTLGRIPTSPSVVGGIQPGWLLIFTTDVDSAIAADLEQQFDATPNYAAGNIQWAPTGPAIGTLTFAFPIRGC